MMKSIGKITNKKSKTLSIRTTPISTLPNSSNSTLQAPVTTTSSSSIPTWSSNQSDFDELNNQIQVIEEHYGGLRLLSKTLTNQTQSAAENIEEGKLLAQTLADYGQICNNYELLPLGNCLRMVGEFQRCYEEMKLKLANVVVEKFCSPLKAFIEEDFSEVKNECDKFREGLGTINTFDDLKTFDKEKRKYYDKKTENQWNQPGRIREKRRRALRSNFLFEREKLNLFD